MYSCSNDNLETEDKLETISMTSTNPGSSRFLRFDVARASRFCESGFGISTMKDVDDAKKRKKELEEAEKNDYGIYQSNSINLSFDPSEDMESGWIDVEYNIEELSNTKEFILDFRLSNKSLKSSQVSLFVDQNVFVEIEGQIYELPANEYKYNKNLGEYGGYSLKIVKK